MNEQTSQSDVERVGWAVTDLDGETILHPSSQLSGRILDFWKGANRLWRLGPSGELLSLTDDEFARATDRAHGRG